MLQASESPSDTEGDREKLLCPFGRRRVTERVAKRSARDAKKAALEAPKNG